MSNRSTVHMTIFVCLWTWRRRWRYGKRWQRQRLRRWSTWRSRELIHKILYHFFFFSFFYAVVVVFLWIVWGFVISVHVYPNNFTSWRSLKKLLSSLCLRVFFGARTERDDVRQLAGPTVQKYIYMYVYEHIYLSFFSTLLFGFWASVTEGSDPAVWELVNWANFDAKLATRNSTTRNLQFRFQFQFRFGVASSAVAAGKLHKSACLGSGRLGSRSRLP